MILTYFGTSTLTQSTLFGIYYLQIRITKENQCIQGSEELFSTLLPFCSTGICVRCDMDSVYMHHKFAVVDGRRLITGSLNWTLTAVQSNMENILITEETDLVRPFIKEFHRLWVRNDPERRRCSSDQKPAHAATRTYEWLAVMNTVRAQGNFHLFLLCYL